MVALYRTTFLPSSLPPPIPILQYPAHLLEVNHRHLSIIPFSSPILPYPSHLLELIDGRDSHLGILLLRLQLELNVEQSDERLRVRLQRVY